MKAKNNQNDKNNIDLQHQNIDVDHVTTSKTTCSSSSEENDSVDAI